MSACTESSWILKHNYFRRPYGIYVIAVWALVLGLQNIARLIYTLAIDAGAPLAQLYLYQWVSVAFSIAFIVAAFGLWNHKNWGRILFLAAAAFFFAIATFGVFSNHPTAMKPVAQWTLVARYAISIALPWIYLNLPFVKKPFFNKTEDTLTYD